MSREALAFQNSLVLHYGDQASAIPSDDDRVVLVSFADKLIHLWERGTSLSGASLFRVKDGRCLAVWTRPESVTDWTTLRDLLIAGLGLPSEPDIHVIEYTDPEDMADWVAAQEQA